MPIRKTGPSCGGFRGRHKRRTRNPQDLQRHLWEIPAVRDLFWILSAAALIGLGYHLRHILLPIFIGWVLAYLTDPLVSAVERRWGLSRWWPVLFLFLLVVLCGSVTGAYLLPIIRDQSAALVERMPEYLQSLGEKYGLGAQDLVEQIQGETAEGAKPIPDLVRRILGTTTHILLWLILVPLYFAFFALNFTQFAAAMHRSLSLDRHPRRAEILARMDEGIGTFFRARVLISALVGTFFVIGWWLAQVPYWFLLGILTGLFNIVPYLSIAGWLIALLVKHLEMTVGADAPGFAWTTVFLWPTVVFALGNFIEGWILTPLIHGRTTQLSAMLILTIVLVGGGIGGFWGLLFAVPVAVCFNILKDNRTFLLAELRGRKRPGAGRRTA